MPAHASGETGLVPVHIGFPDPQRRRPPDDGPHSSRDTLGAMAWAERGLAPRWLGREASDCAAAFEPIPSPSRGGEELHRFLAGAAGRREVALLLAAAGADDFQADLRNALHHGADVTVRVGYDIGTIRGTRLPAGAHITLTPGIKGADRDLGLRLLNGRGEDARWWSLAPTQYYMDNKPLPLGGRLEPILVDGLGDTVVGAWVTNDDSQRWYVLPGPVDWDQMTAWLLEQALPAFAPAALLRARAPHAQTPDLETEAERTAREALDELEQSYTARKACLTADLEKARQAATPIRDGLLFGSSAVLETTVATVLQQAGFTVTELDADLGTTTSADLLAELHGTRKLVEVKSAGGGAPEKLVSQLQRHLDTWPHLRPQTPVDGGVLIVNHHLKTIPAQRPTTVYQRQEFVDSLTVEVIGARQLYDWWRTQDWPAIRAAVLGEPQPGQLAPAAAGQPQQLTKRWPWRRPPR